MNACRIISGGYTETPTNAFIIFYATRKTSTNSIKILQTICKTYDPSWTKPSITIDSRIELKPKLKTTCGDFTSKDFQAFTDGEIFYKTTAGRDEMPSYEKKIPDESDRWALVSYIRTFKK